ncbi:PREDICTED: probable calcium-binding protein CML34 [Camelina sativa]|uniref:Probable calcium-binding protein CML34 n=1 Tax=Camelina sativa TaxID=90675 RepID=A0ABM0Z4T3_CAMSA|nr:PREDICTED: probable calcium-binding protein CML34 [Camelina sativa]
MSAKRVFDKFDKNKDGKLSLDEFREVALAFSPKISQEDIVKFFNEIDADGNGELNADEFTTCIEKMLKEVFDLCDVDGDGKIPVSDSYVTMTNIGKTCTEESCAEKVKAVDADGDGYLNFDEFMALVIGDI